MRSIIVNSQEEIDKAYYYADKSFAPHPLEFPCILKVRDIDSGMGDYYAYSILIAPRKGGDFTTGWLEGANYTINNEVD